MTPKNRFRPLPLLPPLLLYERLIRDRFPETGENKSRRSRFRKIGAPVGVIIFTVRPFIARHLTFIV